LICFLKFSYEEERSMEEIVMSSSAGWPGPRGVLCEEIASSVRSISSPWPAWAPWRREEGVSYDWSVSSTSVLWVTSADSSSSVAVVSCTVSSPSGRSSYPDRDTLALASKNCFQNWVACQSPCS
jgi:hypothetical protein